MTLIEGVGDEVVEFLGVVMVVMVGVFAWWSTNARPGRYRTVVVMRQRPHHPVTVSFRSRTTFGLTNTPASSSTGTNQASPSNTVAITDTVMPRESPHDIIPLREMDSIIDADMAMMNNNRLHFYRRLDAPGGGHREQGVADSTSDESETQEEAEPASNDQIREMDSIVSAMEADVTDGCECFSSPPESNANSASKKPEKNENNKLTAEAKPETAEAESAADAESQNADAANTSTSNEEGDSQSKILIKLKYLNDTLKEVEGSLDELLKDFKWRHFSVELSAEARVRLIFNGRVLLDEAATLRALGLHHRAVVHALVHPKRANTQQQHGIPEEGAVNTTHELVREVPHPERAWDLENILMTLVSVALTVVWFFRCEYSNMFTASASVALFGLTVFYSVAIFGLYLSDTFHFDRRPAQPQPVPNN